MTRNLNFDYVGGWRTGSCAAGYCCSYCNRDWSWYHHLCDYYYTGGR